MDTGWKPMAKKSGNTKKPVSILIIMDTGWKPDTSLQSIITEIGFNPHHNGYGLEVALLFAPVSRLFVSILIIMDTGWKTQSNFQYSRAEPGFNPHHNGYGLEAMR